jgi:signal transduction histidine kinase
MPRWTRVVAALGGLVLALGLGQVLLVVFNGGTVTGALIYAFLIGIPGIVLMYGGYRLPRTDLHPDGYPRIAGWSVAGAGVMLGVVLLIALNPGGGIDRPVRSSMIAAAMGSLAGFAIGVNESRAITQAREAEYQAAEAERGREILGFLNSTLRHEVLNGLNIIRGTTTELAKELEEETRPNLDVIEARCEDLADLIEDIRPMARALSGEAEITEIDLSAMVSERVDALRATYPEATVTAEIPADVSGQASQGFSHALSNLMANAIEHNDQDSPRVDVSVTPVDEMVHITIADNGPGLDDVQKERVFKRETERNSGFGLHMAETLVSHLGGNLSVEDNDPRGAIFTVELPRLGADQ